jgi:hypothetical protein
LIVLEIVEITALAALVFAVAALAFLYVACALGWNELRSALLHRAYKSFTFDGVLLLGVRPHLVARLVIRSLSTEDDERKPLLLEALATEEPESPRVEARRTATS